MITDDLIENLFGSIDPDKVKVFKLNKDEAEKLEGRSLFDVIKYLRDKEEKNHDDSESEPEKSVLVGDDEERTKVYENEDKMEETFKPAWGIIRNDSNNKDYVSLIVTAPFAIKESVKVSVSKDSENPKGYAVTVKWNNSKIPVVAGTFKLKESDQMTILGFKKIDKKSAKVTYQDGCFIISVKQISEKESDIFTFGM